MEIAIYNQQQVSEILKSNRIPDDLIPKTTELSLKLLGTYPTQYYKTLSPAKYDDVFNSPLPSLVKCKTELGVMRLRAVLVSIITDLALSFNVGANMNQDQVAETVDDIIQDYYYLKLDDLKLCFKNGKRERYGKIYRLDESVILSWLDKYVEDRFNSAEQSSGTAHASTTTETRVESVEQVYKEFERRKFK